MTFLFSNVFWIYRHNFSICNSGAFLLFLMDGFCSLRAGELCNNGNTTSTTNSSRRRTTLISPNGLPEFEGFMEPLRDREAILSSPCVTPSCEAITLKEGGEKPE
jgi:hypothetical protein